MPAKPTTRVEIYDQSYAIGGQDPDYVQRLAAQVDAKMRQVARETRVVDSMRVAVLAAINLADENESLRSRCQQLEALVTEKAQRLHHTLDRLLTRRLNRMRILFIGDIYAQAGRRVVRDHLADIVANRGIDLVVANGENAAAGFGITGPLAEELLGYGIEVLTTGNHVWDKREIVAYWEQAAGIAAHPAHRLLRPANFPAALPGAGMWQGRARNGEAYAILNLQGRVFMTALDCPFRRADALLAALPADCRTILVDIHAEASSEKQAMGWYLDGRVSAVIGTHTHVPTADERILPGGTAFQTDVGMTGAYAGVIGSRTEDVLRRLLEGYPARLEPAGGDVRLWRHY